jgi:hypothetical protein
LTGGATKALTAGASASADHTKVLLFMAPNGDLRRAIAETELFDA